MKKRVRLTESDLHRIVKETVQNIVSESWVKNGDIPLEQPKEYKGWMKQGEDPEWMEQQRKNHPYVGKSKQSVRVSEAQLHQIVKESVERILSEGWFGNLFKSSGQRDFERRRKEAQDAYNKFKSEQEQDEKNSIDPRTISDDDMDRNDYRIIYGTIAGYTPNWRERAQRENERQRKAYLNGRSHY